MVRLDEARARKTKNEDIDVILSEFWSFTRQSIASRQDAEDRMETIYNFYKYGSRIRRKNKATGRPYKNNGIRHSHVYENKLDPIIMYRFSPGVDERPGRLIFIALTTHAEAFNGNEDNFYHDISEYLNEGMTYPSMRAIIDTVSSTSSI